MNLGEQLFFALVVSAFLIFGAVLAVVSVRTNRYLRRKALREVVEQSSLKNAA